MHLDMMPGYVAIHLDPPEEMLGKAKLIAKPDIAKGDNHYGVVVAVRDECWIEPGSYTMSTPKVAVGDRVLIGRYAATPIEWDGGELHIIKHSHILAKVTSTSPVQDDDTVACAQNY